MEENELENQRSMRRFMIVKYIIELSFMVAIFLAIGFARYFSFIDSATTGAMGGLVIGYFASDIRKIHT